MASISRVLFWRHLRSTPSFHVLHYRRGRPVRSGRGLAFWFLPLSTAVAEVPCDDRDQAFLFHGRSSDFQDVAAQGTITYRVVEPEWIAPRIDFSIDLDTGVYLKSPLDQLSELLSQMAQQVTWDYLTHTPLRAILAEGVEQIRRRIREGLVADPALAEIGLEIVSIRVSDVSPTSELEQALQAPTREEIQQQSDEAVFRRRALAVEKERAISENELQNEIELARREEELIAQRGQNKQHEARDDAEAGRIEAESSAVMTRLNAAAEAESIAVVEEARVNAERDRIDIYRDLPATAHFGLAAQQLGGTLERIDHLSLSPDAIGPLLTQLVAAGTRKLEENGEAP